jgi:hypothetical protein
VRSAFEQQANFPVASVIAERDGASIRRADAAVRGQEEELVTAQRLGVPPHAYVLTPAEQIA